MRAVHDVCVAIGRSGRNTPRRCHKNARCEGEEEERTEAATAAANASTGEDD